MNDEKFKEFVVEKLNYLNDRTTKIDEKLSKMEGEFGIIKKVVFVILAIMLAKFGVDFVW